MDVKVFESGRGHLVNAKWGIWFYDRSWYELSDEELHEVKSYKFTVAVVIAKPRNIVDLMMSDPISFIHTCALARYIVNYIDGMGSIDLDRLARDVRPDLLETAAARLERMRDKPEPARMPLLGSWIGDGYEFIEFEPASAEKLAPPFTMGDKKGAAVDVCKSDDPQFGAWRVLVQGQDDFSWTKWFVTKAEAEIEVRYLRIMQPLQLEADLLWRGYEFTN